MHAKADCDVLMLPLMWASVHQAKEAIALAMQPVSTPNTPTAEADDEAKRYSQRERAQVVMYSPGRTKHQMAAKAAVPAASKTRRHEVCNRDTPLAGTMEKGDTSDHGHQLRCLIRCPAPAEQAQCWIYIHICRHGDSAALLCPCSHTKLLL